MTTNYRIRVKNKSGTALGEFSIWRNLSFGKTRNAYDQCSFDIPANSSEFEDLYSPRDYFVEILRNNVLVWSGEQAIRKTNLTATGNDWTTITCYDWLEQLTHRFTPAEVTYALSIEGEATEENITYDKNASEIAWDLINNTQNDDWPAQTTTPSAYADLGITQGTLTSEGLFDIEKKFYNQSIYEAIKGMSEERFGFDFNIDLNRQFNTYYSQGISRTSSVFILHGKDFNICTITENFANPVTRALVLGEEWDGSGLIREERTSEDSVSSVIGLRENVFNQNDISDSSTLQTLGDQALSTYQKPILNFTVDILPNSQGIDISKFSLGDTIRIGIVQENLIVDVAVRVNQWKVDFTSEEYLSLELGEV